MTLLKHPIYYLITFSRLSLIYKAEIKLIQLIDLHNFEMYAFMLGELIRTIWPPCVDDSLIGSETHRKKTRLLLISISEEFSAAYSTSKSQVFHIYEVFGRINIIMTSLLNAQIFVNASYKDMQLNIWCIVSQYRT